MGGGNYTFWLGASADADPATRADASSPTVSTKGFNPARCTHPHSLVQHSDATGVFWICKRCGTRI